MGGYVDALVGTSVRGPMGESVEYCVGGGSAEGFVSDSVNWVR